MAASKTRRSPAKPAHPGWLERYWLLAGVGALVAIGLVFAAPSEAGSSRFLGLSLARWALVAVLAAVAAGCAALRTAVRRQHPLAARVQAALGRPRLLNSLLGLALLVAALAFYLALFSLQSTDAFVQARLLRLLPLVLWALWAALLALLIGPRLRPAAPDERGDAGSILRPAAVALLVLVLAVAFMLASGLGLQPDRTGWDTPGAPVLNTQILLAWLAAVALAGLAIWANRCLGWQFTRLDALAAFGLWLLAVVLWTAQPLLATHFSLAPVAPNFDFYPNSDAATLDVAAQSFLIGQGFTDVVEKPLYAIFLVFLHAVVGQDYASVVNAQILLLALFPVALYFLAVRMHGRLAGLLIALVVILREVNTLALSGRILVSHSKLLMTDLPTALGLAAFTLLVLHWLQHKVSQPRWALWLGAAFGLLLLLRSQILVFLPFLLLLAIWRAGGGWKPRSQVAAALLLGFLLTAVPWMWRNGERTGQFGYSQPFQALYMARQYSLTPELGDPGFPPNTPVSQYVPLGFARVAEFATQYPLEVARFITAHFLHNEVSSLLALPARFDLTQRAVEFYNLQPYWQGKEGQLWAECCSLRAYIDGTPYWAAWDGRLPADAWLPLAFNLAVLSVGIGAAWRKLGWLAAVPIGMHLLYSLSTALARVSGWRLILPVDWVILLFYCIGLSQLILWGARYLFRLPSGQAEPAPARRKRAAAVPRRPALGLLASAALALLAGAAIPLAEYAGSPLYAGFDRAAAQAAWAASPVAQGSGFASLQDFLAQPRARVYWGRALYPGVYESGELEFRIIGPQAYDRVVLPLQAPPAAFPNAADVLVLGCSGPERLQAAAVVFLNGEAADLAADGTAPFDCGTAP